MPTPPSIARAHTARSRRLGAALVAMTLATGLAAATTPAARAAHSAADVWGDSGWGDALANALSLTNNGTYSAAQDPGSLYTIENAIGARSVWRRPTDGKAITGQGVTVALLDTGTAPVAGLDGPARSPTGRTCRSRATATCATRTPSATAPTWPASSPPTTATALDRQDPSARRDHRSSAWLPTPACSPSSWPPPTAAPTSARSSPRWTG